MPQTKTPTTSKKAKRVLVVRDGVFTRNEKGEVCARTAVDYETFSKRYLDGFKEVVLIGRVFDKVDPTQRPATGPGVTFIEMPSYRGPKEMVGKIPAIIKSIVANTPRGQAYMLRIPMIIPFMFAVVLACKRIPFGVEVIGDPADAYSKETTKHPLSFIFRPLFTLMTKWACWQAAGSAYVTREALQKSYPPRKGRPTFNYTSLELKDEYIVTKPRTQKSFNMQAPTLVNVGTMQQHYKGHDLMIEAVKVLREEHGVDVNLKLISDGVLRPEFEQLAKDMGAAKHVHFLGMVPHGDPLWKEFDSSDIFILPSRQEGLPRAMIDACARGLPCVGSNVGGTAELIRDDMVIPRNDVPALVDRILKIVSSPKLAAELSAENLQTAHTYKLSEVRKARAKYYKTLAELSV